MPLSDTRHPSLERSVEPDTHEDLQLASIRRGLADAKAGRFASDDDVARVFAKYSAAANSVD
ncbi:MAG: hypothetical protein AAGC60_10830 [Acidobacteriota bacterium]